MIPEIRYALSGQTNIAYSVLGGGPVDLMVMSYVLPIDGYLSAPEYSAMFERLKSFSRVICFDRGGIGFSDPFSPENPPTAEQMTRDAASVLDAVGSQRVAVLSDLGSTAVVLLFAAANPHRVSHLVLFQPAAYGRRQPDYPWGFTQEEIDLRVREAEEEVRTGIRVISRFFSPTVEDDPDAAARNMRMSRQAASPATQATLMRISHDIDARPVLPAIQAPTLIINKEGAHRGLQRATGYVAERIPGARLVDLPGPDLTFWSGDVEPALDAIEEFITGTKPVPRSDSVFATIVFTDIVGSTERLAAAGDRAWRELLDRNDAVVHRELTRFDGRLVNPTGDGIVATFDGPARAIRCAQQIVLGAEQIGLSVRAGLHAGEVERRGEDVAGIAVHTAQRVSALANGGEVLVSRTVADLVAGSGLAFEDRGEHELKGVPGRWQLFAVKS